MTQSAHTQAPKCRYCGCRLALDQTEPLCPLCQGEGRQPDRVEAKPELTQRTGKAHGLARELLARTFDTASELAAEASRRTGKRVTEDMVEAIVGYQPAYDGHDLQAVLDHLGWRKRPEKRQSSQLQKELEKIRGRLGVPSPPPDFKALYEKLYESVDALLKAWFGRSWVEGRNAVRSALCFNRSLDEARERLRQSFPHAPPPPKEAVLAVRRLWKESKDWEPLWVQCWREAERLSRSYVNRGRDRKLRQLYVEDLFFRSLWWNEPLNQSELDRRLPMMTETAWNARRRLPEACRVVPPPRSFEALLRAAHRLQGGTAQPYDRAYQAFRRLIYDNTTRAEREHYRTWQYEPSRIMLGSDPRLR